MLLQNPSSLETCVIGNGNLYIPNQISSPRSIEIFNLTQETSRVVNVPTMPINLKCSLIYDDNLYLLGDRTHLTIFNLTSETSRDVTYSAGGHRSFCKIIGTKLYAFETVNPSVDIFDLVTETTETVALQGSGTIKTGDAYEDKFYIVRNNSTQIEIFDINTKTSRLLPILVSSQYNSVVVYKGKLYVYPVFVVNGLQIIDLHSETKKTIPITGTLTANTVQALNNKIYSFGTNVNVYTLEGAFFTEDTNSVKSTGNGMPGSPLKIELAPHVFKPMIVDLTSQLDGVLETFVIPSFITSDMYKAL